MYEKKTKKQKNKKTKKTKKQKNKKTKKQKNKKKSLSHRFVMLLVREITTSTPNTLTYLKKNELFTAS